MPPPWNTMKYTPVITVEMARCFLQVSTWTFWINTPGEIQWPRESSESSKTAGLWGPHTCLQRSQEERKASLAPDAPQPSCVRRRRPSWLLPQLPDYSCVGDASKDHPAEPINPQGWEKESQSVVFKLRSFEVCSGTEMTKTPRSNHRSLLLSTPLPVSIFHIKLSFLQNLK